MKACHLEWDSAFFKKNIGVLSKNENCIVENINNFDLLYVIDIEVEHIPNFTCSYEGTQVVLSKTHFEEPVSNHQISSMNSSTNFSFDKIYELALLSGTWSRFKKDKKFTTEEFQLLYKKWVQNSLNKKIADDVLIYHEQDEILGFITYKIENSKAVIGLLAVSPTCKRTGIGTTLLNAFEAKALQLNLNSLEVKTQLLNKTAINFYQKAGYSISKKINIKHFWKN